MARYNINQILTVLALPSVVLSYAHIEDCFYDPIVAGTEHKLLSPNLNISCPAVVISLDNGTDIPLIVANTTRCLVRPELSLFVPTTVSGQMVLTWGCEAQNDDGELNDQDTTDQETEPCIAYEISSGEIGQGTAYTGTSFSISQSCAVPFQTGVNAVGQGGMTATNSVAPTATSSINSTGINAGTKATIPTSSTIMSVATGSLWPSAVSSGAVLSGLRPSGSFGPSSIISDMSSESNFDLTYAGSTQPIIEGSHTLSVYPLTSPLSQYPSAGVQSGAPLYATPSSVEPFYTNIASIGSCTCTR